MPGRIAEEIHQTKPLSLVAEAALNLYRTSDYLALAVARVLKSADLSAVQFNVLRILRGAGSAGLCCREIGERLVTRDPDITRLLDRMERRGIIERSRDSKDRRVITVRITPPGLDLLEQLDGPVEQELQCRLGRLGEQRLTALIETLEQIRETGTKGD
ncbi:MAG TPA: MarR family transcriptional regulator [Bryobacteraceae bacterium]|nr:MarR family transcriptional regulator [Bryobacteraceae bacterium]